MSIIKEIQKRRTFAIISHPDAGKTTLTEKLLLYGGAVQLAGSVTARKNQRATTSDWMELERKRGISISSTVLQFDYDGYRINLLDTPGSQGFLRGHLPRADGGGCGGHGDRRRQRASRPQTRKLFEVCRQRGVPIFTFMNKCDRPMQRAAGAAGRTGAGAGHRRVSGELADRHRASNFRACIDRQRQAGAPVRAHGRRALPRAGVRRRSRRPDDPRAARRGDVRTRSSKNSRCWNSAGETFDDAAVLAGKTTPVFFGSAVNNFGVQLLLDGFLNIRRPRSPA